MKSDRLKTIDWLTWLLRPSRACAPLLLLWLGCGTALQWTGNISIAQAQFENGQNRYVQPSSKNFDAFSTGNGSQSQNPSVPINPQTAFPQPASPPNINTLNAYQTQPIQPAVPNPYAGESINAIPQGQPYTQPYTQPYPQPYTQQQPYSPATNAYTNGALQQAPIGSLPPLNQPWAIDPDSGSVLGPGTYQPRIRDVPVNVYAQEAQTGRIVLGGSVNTDLGVSGQVIVEERNFDIFNFPTSFRDIFNGAFRGGGQNFRLEAVPGNQVQRYSVDLTEPNLFGYSPFSLSVGGFLFDRIYRDYSEERLGGRVALGYVVTPDLQVSTELRLENVNISNPRVNGVPILDRSLGDTDLYTGRLRLTHNTRDSPFLPTQGHHLEVILDQVFGEFVFPRAQVNFSRYFLVRERADGGGRQTLSTSYKLGFLGSEAPIFENFFAGGFSTLRGFRFRGASPVVNGVQVGGRFQFLGSLEYMFPLTADDALRAVTFVDYGITEQNIDFNFDNFRVAPGFGLRVAVPALGPSPLAFDFSFPVNSVDTDQRQVFSFNVSGTR